MSAELRILNFVKNMCIGLLYLVLIFVGFNATLPVNLGILAGGLLVTCGFHFMCGTLKKALTPPHDMEMGPALVKFYLRFVVSVAIITILIAKNYVHPFGLVVGLSVLPISFLLAAFRETLRLFR